MAEISPEAPFHKEIERLDELIRKAVVTGEADRVPTQDRIVVVGASLFPDFDGKKTNLSDNIRGLQILETVKKLNKQGIDICIVDGGSSEIFARRVRRINPRLFHTEETTRKPATIYDVINMMEASEKAQKKGERFPGTIWFLQQKQKGYSQARVEGIKAITDVVTGLTGHGVIVQMEIEKTQVAEEMEKLTRPILDGKADIAIPDRGIRVKELGDEYDNFCNYPKFQAVSERKANLLIHQMLVEAGLRKSDEPVLDLFGGTRAIKADPELRRLFGVTFKIPENSPFWGKVRPQVYSNAVYFPVYIAMALNKRVISVPINFSYPPRQSKLEQKDESFEMKRQQQFEDIVYGSRLLVDFLGRKFKAVRLAGKIIDQDVVLKALRGNAVVDLKEMEWTDKNEFEEEEHYRKVRILSLAEKIINSKLIIIKLEEALESYFSNFDPQQAFLGWREFERVKKRVGLLKKGVKLFGYTREAESIYQKHREEALTNLSNATLAFYVYGDSEASRNLDIAAFFAEAVEVPKTEYVVAVLRGTPESQTLKELDDLVKHFRLSPEDRKKIIHNFTGKVLSNVAPKKKADVFRRIVKGFRISPDEASQLRDRFLR